MNKQKKITTCKHCGAEIAKAAKTCPHCGGKNKKPIYLRPWFIILVVIILIGAFGSSGSDTTNTTSTDTSSISADPTPAPTEIVYTQYTVAQMVDDLNNNAMKASSTYKDQYVEITGTLYVIDSDGSYFSLEPKKNSYTFTNVQCFMDSDEQKSVIMDCKTGEKLVVKGYVTSVGEVIGYSIDVHEVAKAK